MIKQELAGWPLRASRRNERTAMMFSVVPHRRAATLRLAVTGEIDMSTTGRLEQALSDAFASDAQVITVDLSATTFCDYTGLTTLLTAYHQAQARHLRYYVTNPRGVVLSFPRFDGAVIACRRLVQA